MLSGPEERRRMREEKARQRQERAAKRKKIRLILAAIVLVACGVLIFFVARKAPTSDLTPTESAPPATESAPVPTETAPATTEIHYRAAGDLNINELTVAAGGENYYYIYGQESRAASPASIRFVPKLQ